MLQLKLSPDVHDSELLRDHIEANADEIVNMAHDEVPLSVVVKRIGRETFAVDLHARIFGRLLVVSASHKDIFAAVTEARRHLTRKIKDLKWQRLAHKRGRHLGPELAIS